MVGEALILICMSPYEGMQTPNGKGHRTIRALRFRECVDLEDFFSTESRYLIEVDRIIYVISSPMVWRRTTTIWLACLMSREPPNLILRQSLVYVTHYYPFVLPYRLGDVFQ